MLLLSFNVGSPRQSPSRQNSRDSIDEETDYVYDDGTRSRNPVRRSNSSPEMSASWKNPFLLQKTVMEVDDGKCDEENGKKSKMYSKDMRVSCEAIPEEIASSGWSLQVLRKVAYWSYFLYFYLLVNTINMFPDVYGGDNLRGIATVNFIYHLFSFHPVHVQIQAWWVLFLVLGVPIYNSVSDVHY